MVRAWSVFSRPIVDGEEQPMRDPSRIRVPGPLEPYAEGFRGELAGRGYSPGAAAVQLQLMAHLSGWLAGRGLDTAGLTSALVDAYLAERRRLGCASHWTRRALAPLLGFLRRREVVPAEATPGPAGSRWSICAPLTSPRSWLPTARTLVVGRRRGWWARCGRCLGSCTSRASSTSRWPAWCRRWLPGSSPGCPRR